MEKKMIRMKKPRISMCRVEESDLSVIFSMSLSKNWSNEDIDLYNSWVAKNDNDEITSFVLYAKKNDKYPPVLEDSHEKIQVVDIYTTDIESDELVELSYFSIRRHRREGYFWADFSEAFKPYFYKGLYGDVELTEDGLYQHFFLIIPERMGTLHYYEDK